MLAPDPNAATHAESRLIVCLGLVLALLATAEASAWFMENTWIKRDGRFYVNVNASIVETMSFEQSGFADSWYTGKLGWNRNLDAGWSNIALGSDGQHWPKHPWLMPVLSTPMFFALGLPGSLLFNLLMLVAAGLSATLWLRRAPRAPAVLAVLGLLFATSVRDYSYDYLVDVLLLALFIGSLAALEHKRAALTGLLFGLCLMLKPTTAIWAPSLVMLAVELRPNRRWWLSAALAGLGVLLVWAFANQLMFGRPWWTGYHRTLVVVSGQPTVASHLDLFSTSFWEGFKRQWLGHWGLAHRYCLLLLALPGLFSLARRRPWTVAASASGFVAAQVVFAFYRYEGDRFHWPALALLLPALAESLRCLSESLLRCLGRLRLAMASEREPWLAGLAGLAMVAASLGPNLMAGHDLHVRLGATGAVPPAVWLTAQLLSTGAAVFFAARLGKGLAPASLAALVPAALLLIPAARAEWLASGLQLPAAALLLAGCQQLAAGRRLWAAGLCAAGVLLAWPELWPGWMPRGRQAAATLSQFGPTLLQVGPARSMWPLLPLAAAGAWPALRRLPALAPVLLVLALPGQLLLRGDLPSPLAMLLLALLSLPALDRLSAGGSRLAAWMNPRRALVSAALLLGLLMTSGLIRLASLHCADFRLASEPMLRRAQVSLQNTPCDFLAWEHMSWECSHLDDTRWSTMVGLGLPEGIRFGGLRKKLLLIPAGRRGQTRRVAWDGVEVAGRSLRLRYGVPDGLLGRARLVVKINGREKLRITVPEHTAGRLLSEDIDLRSYAGSRVRLELELSPEGGRHQAAVAVDGRWI